MDPKLAHDAQVLQNLWWLRHRMWRAHGSHTPEGRAAFERRQSEVVVQVCMLWLLAPNWATLVELNRRYLQGRLPGCVSNNKPTKIDDAHGNDLLRLHEYGLVTTHSCPGMASDLVRQRAFLYFSIPTTRALATRPGTVAPFALRDFILGLVLSPQIRFHARYQYSMPSPDRPRAYEIMKFLQPNGFCDNLPNLQDHEWEHEYWMAEHDDEGEFIGFSFVQHVTRPHIGQQLWDIDPESGVWAINRYGSYFADDRLGPPIPASFQDDPLQICVVAREWDFRGIPRLIEALLQDAGVVRSPDFVQQDFGRNPFPGGVQRIPQDQN